MATIGDPSIRALGTAYAVQGRALVHISSVPRGLECGCVCPQCHMKMVAKKGQIREHYFAHHDATNCDGGAESILHRLAKEIFESLGSVELPEYRFRLKRKFADGGVLEVNERVIPAGSVNIASVTRESRLGSIVPDIVLNPGPEALLVEIAVTHAVDRKKSRAIRRLSLPTIEIRLKPEDAWLTREQLKIKLTRDANCKHWIFHPDQRIHEKPFYAGVRKHKRDNRARLRDPRYLLGTECRNAALLMPRRHGPAPRRKSSSPEEDLWIINKWAEWFKRLNGRDPSVAEGVAYHLSRRQRR